MASICKHISVDVPADDAWDAIRDIGALHDRLVRGFVVDTTVEGDVRVVTFANGMVARELIVDIDDDARRLAYTVLGDLFVHHHASVVVEPTGPATSQITWTADLLPNDIAGDIDAMMDAGATAMRLTLAGAPERR